MKQHGYSRLLNFAWYQTLWFTAVVGGTECLWVLALLLLVHLLWIECWRSELFLMLACALCGAVADSLLAEAGFYRFESTPHILPVPLWLLGIWMGFAGTLRFSMRWLSSRPLIMASLSAVGAPLTYFAAARLGAVTFVQGTELTALAIALTWLVLTPLLCWFTRCAGQLQTNFRRSNAAVHEQEIQNA